MTYFEFLLIFLGIPITLLLGLTLLDRRAGRRLPPALANLSPWLILGVHVVVALLYTTPWDNYLVATGVWFYDPELVTGITIGWVPIEEYTFFIVQPIMTGLLLLFLARRLREPEGETPDRPRMRAAVTAGLGLVWAAALATWISGWAPGTYLSLILVWALPPIMLQSATGADLLWRYRRLVALGILVPTVYLGAADSLAIAAGTWTIEPSQSLEIFLPGGLPLEEFVFFLVTNTLLVFGMTLTLSCAMGARAQRIFTRLNRRGASGRLANGLPGESCTEARQPEKQFSGS